MGSIKISHVKHNTYMYKTITIAIGFFLQVYAAFGQSNFVEGIVVTLHHDTLKGKMDYAEWDYNPKKIRFRQGNSLKEVVYTPANLLSFQIPSKKEYYERTILALQEAPIDVQRIKTYSSRADVNAQPNTILDTIFLRVIAKGRLNLWELQRDQHFAQYFIQKNNDAIHELINRQVRIQNQDSSGIVTIQTYKRQLHALTQDCPTQKATLENLDYNRANLLEIVKNYNICHKETSFIQTQERGNTYLSILAGLTQPQASMNSIYQTASFFETQIIDSSKIGPCIGISLEHNYGRLRGKLAIGAEFKGAFVTVHHTEIVKASFDHHYQYSMKSFLWSTNVYMRYYFGAGSIKPYAKAGIGFIYYTEPEMTLVHTNLGISIIQKIPLQKTKMNYLCSIGVKWNSFLLEGRLESWFNGLGTDLLILRYPSLIAGYSWNLSPQK
jgi:hypothetical protein